MRGMHNIKFMRFFMIDQVQCSRVMRKYIYVLFDYFYQLLLNTETVQSNMQ